VIDIGGRDADVPLSALGRRQAEALGSVFRREVDARSAAIWASPYTRAIDTARAAMDSAGPRAGLRIDDRLRDRELGILDTLTALGVRTRYPVEAERRRTLGKFYYRPPGGESWTDIALRVRSFVSELVLEAAPEDSVWIFTHDAVVTMFRYACLGLSEAETLELATSDPIGNASITRLVLTSRPRTWQVVDYNVQDHLLVAGEDLRTVHPGEPDVHPH
jgi:broad specificity phosphatase PhoE